MISIRYTVTGRRLAAVLLLLCGHSYAQSIDYGALEQLVGEPVTTSVTGAPQRASDVPANMEIITAEDIRRSGAYDVPGVLRHVLGVQFQQWTNDQAEISLDGYDQAFSQRVLVLIDGRQVYADYFSFTPWSALPIELAAIRQIEVVKGPACALFGFNAVAGVINIVTYNPIYDDVSSVSASAGTQALSEGSFIATLQGGNAGLRIFGGGRSDEDFSTPIPPEVDNGGRRNESRRDIDLEGGAKLGDRGEVTVDLNGTDAAQNDITPVYASEISEFATNAARVQLSYDAPVGLLEGIAYTNWMEQHTAPGFAGQDFDFTNRISVVQLQDLFKAGARHTFRVAVEYRSDSTETTPFGPGEVLYHVWSGSAMWEWKVAPSVTFTNAVRLDSLSLAREGPLPPGYPFTTGDWDRTLQPVSYNSGLVWKPDDADTLRLTTGRGALLPNLLNLGARLAVTPDIGLSGSPFLRPTTVTQNELSWTRALSSVGAQIKLAAFDEQTDSVQDLGGGFSDAGGAPYALPTNIGNSRARGVESGIDGTVDHWRWGLNATFETIIDRFDPEATDGVAFVDFEDTTPHVIANANIGWSSSAWEVDTYLQYDSRTFGLQPVVVGLVSQLTPISGYLEADARVGYRLPHQITLALSGQNVLHAEQRQTSAADVQRRVLGTVTMQF